MFKRLLVPLDGSPLAEAVLPAAAYLAGTLGASVMLIHVVEKNAPKEVHGYRHLTDEDEACAYLEETAQRAFPPGVAVECHVHATETSSVTRSIVEHVGEFGSDLIVMCTHGRGDIRSWVFGSNAQQVIAAGPCPVLLIQPRESGAAPDFICRRILIPLDGNPDHEQVLPVAAECAAAFGAAVDLVTAVATRASLSGERAAISTLLPSATSALLDLMGEGAADYLKGPMAQLAGAGLSVTAHFGRGDPAQVVAAVAQEIGADLIVLATHGTPGMKAFWEGSLTPKVARQTPVPLLLVRVHEAAGV